MKTNLKEFFAGDEFSFCVSEVEKEFEEAKATAIFMTDKEAAIRIEGTKSNKKIYFKIEEESAKKFKKSDYKLFVFFEGDDFKKTIFLKNVAVFDNVTDASCVNSLSYNKKMLEIINNVLNNVILDGYASYTIGTRSIVRMSPESLLKMKEHFEELVEREENTVNGLNKSNKIIIKYGSFYS